MDISSISNKYKVRKLSDKDVEKIYALEVGNPMFFDFCPPVPSVESIREDMVALPPNKTFEDKFYLGFYKNEKLIAVMDLIGHYPREDIAFIGFFMMDRLYQGRGIGSMIIEECLAFLKEKGYRYVRLGYMKKNEQSKHFWVKNKFIPTGIETDNGQGIVVVMQRQINK